MITLEQIKIKYPGWEYFFIAYIDLLSWEPSSLNLNNLADLVLTGKGGNKNKLQVWPPKNCDFNIKIKFLEVQDLKLTGFSSNPFFISGFDVVDIRDRYWENKNYEIEDYENGAIHFYSRGVEILEFNVTKEPQLKKIK